MKIRLCLLAMGIIIAIAPIVSWTQQTNRVPIVGILQLATGPADPVNEGFKQGLQELGYVEGRNIRIEFRTAQNDADRLPGLAEELVQLRVDVIVVMNAQTARAVKRATSTIPIVTALFDPVSSGLVTDLAHPGGNVTGFTVMWQELAAKRLQVLKETVPRITRVGVLRNPVMSSAPGRAKFVEDLDSVARSLSIELKFVDAQTPVEFDAAFLALSRARAQALYLVDSPLFYVHRTTLAKLALKEKLPTISAMRPYVDEGGLMSYGADWPDQLRRSAVYVDKILKGAKPGDLPIEQPTKFELVVNLKTAKALGITIPQSIPLRADEVIR